VSVNFWVSGEKNLETSVKDEAIHSVTANAATNAV
jgi:hypothetical protein